MKKWCCALLSLWVCLLFSGCNFAGFDSQALISPPKANADQQSIHKLLQGSRPDITFVYPKTGEYRSAVIMRDFTGDGQEDAVGFRAQEDDSVEVQFLTKNQEGQWRSAAAFDNTASQVDRVCFGDLNGDGRQDVVIGWGSTSGITGRTAQVCAYLCNSNGDITETNLGTYGEMTVTDFDNDGVNELFTADKYVPSSEEGVEALPATARVFAWKNGSLQEICSAEADNSITGYSSVTFGRVSPRLRGVVLDGARADNSLTTQIFFLSEDGTQLLNRPDGVNTETYQNPFSRPSTAPFLSRDINGDGIVEVPVTSQLPGIPDEITPDSTSYLVEWSVYSGESGGRNVLRTLMNLNENYWFGMPFGMMGRLSASNDTDRRTVTYTEVVAGQEDGAALLGSPLFSIRVFTRSAWESRGQTGGYEQLAAQNDLVYGIQVITTDEKYSHAIDQVKKSFKLIAE